MSSTSKWTEFWDMCSGGSQKEDFSNCYIEAPYAEAKVIFYNRFGHNPERVTCSCCGEDYSISEKDSLEQATAFHRNCSYDNEKKEYAERPKDNRNYVSVEEFEKLNHIKVIRADEIKKEERVGTVPDEGYVWV